MLNSGLTVFIAMQIAHSVFTYQMNVFMSHGIMHKKQ